MKLFLFLSLGLAAWPALSLLGAPEARSLTDAATRGDTAAMAAAIAQGEPVDARDAWSWTPLICAVHAGKTDAVRLLLSRHANPNLLTAKGCSPLDFAVEEGHDEAVSLLLDAGADPNGFRVPMNNGGTSSPLFMAVQHDRLAVAKLLLAHGARVNDRNNRGSTALIQASRLDDVDQIHWLIGQGADLHAAAKDDNDHPYGPLEAATQEGRPYVLEALTDAGVKPADRKNAFNEALNQAIGSDDYERTQAALANGASPTEPADNGVLPITVAVLKGDPGIVQLLIKAGADVNANPTGNPLSTPMAHLQERMKLAKSPQEIERFQRVAELLRKAGASQ